MRPKEVAEPTDIAGVQERIDGVDEENERYYNPNDVETSARIAWGTTEPVSLHKVSVAVRLFVSDLFAIRMQLYGTQMRHEKS